MKSSELKFDWRLIGNSQIVDLLEKSISNNKLASTYIFEGPDNLGKTTFAIRFAQILLCQGENKRRPCDKCSSCKRFLIKPKDMGEPAREFDFGEIHGDFHIIKREKDKKDISVEQVREFIRKLSMSSFLNSYKIGVIKHAHSLNEEAANALLKTLEEPKAKVIIILVTSNINALPLTIVSRSQVFKFKQINPDIIYDYLIKEHRATRSAAKNFSHLSLGRPVLAVKFLEDKDFYESYLQRVRTFFKFINQDLNERFQAIEKLIKSSGGGQETVKLTKRIIEIWLGLLRDMLLLEFNQDGLIQHEIVEEELTAVKKKLPLKSLLHLVEILKQGDKYLETNVNPKLVLENIAVNI